MLGSSIKEERMKTSQHTAEQIIRILEQAEKGDQTIAAVCRTHGIAENTFYRWRKAYGGMSVSEVQRLKELEAEQLIYRSLPAVGNHALLAAIAQVSIGTLDQLIQEQRTTYGAAGAAQMLLSILQNMEYDPSWWQLAYRRDGILVGGSSGVAVENIRSLASF